MTDSEFILVGRIRKAHGIRGEVVVELLTDEPDAIFASGRRVFAGNASGDLSPNRQELTVASTRPFNEGLLVRFDVIPDRTAADAWRGRFLLVPASEIAGPAEGEVYVHELPGMRVQLESGDPLGIVEETYELPQGLALDVRRAPPHDSATVLVLFDERTVLSVDREARLIVVALPDGLLE